MVDTNLMNFDGWILVMNAKFSFYEARYDLERLAQYQEEANVIVVVR